VAYIGALGPAQRKQWLLDEVSDLVPAMPGDVSARLRGPIGLDLGDRSAPGIAIAVIAEVLAVLNRRTARPLLATAGDLVAASMPRVCYA
jgi:xanthine dehydrogenase accessory factor